MAGRLAAWHSQPSFHGSDMTSEAALSIWERAINLPIQSMDPSALVSGAPEPSRSGAASTEYLLTLRELNKMSDERLNLDMIMRNIPYGNATTREYKCRKYSHV